MLTSSSLFSLNKRKKVDKLFLRLQYKLSSNLKNKGNFLLSIDILRDVIKRELLKIIVLNIETKFLASQSQAVKGGVKVVNKFHGFHI